MIFEKPSLRTRVTFEVGMTQLGGYAVYLTPNDFRLGERESVADIARNLERWVDFIMARTNSHLTLTDLAAHARVPVINGLSDAVPPGVERCFTLIERRAAGGRAWPGSAAATSPTRGSRWPRLGFLALACPRGYEPDQATLDKARAEGASVLVTADPQEALRDADVIYTDAWTSMGQEAEAAARRQTFRAYQVNAAALRRANDAVIMHCLPPIAARRSPTVNRSSSTNQTAYIQKGVLVWLNQQMGRH
jgi:ornithine carbamoyltransferase